MGSHSIMHPIATGPGDGEKVFRLRTVAPADVYIGRGTSSLRMRWKIKQQTLNERRRLHRQSKVA